VFQKGKTIKKGEGTEYKTAVSQSVSEQLNKVTTQIEMWLVFLSKE